MVGGRIVKGRGGGPVAAGSGREGRGGPGIRGIGSKTKNWFAVSIPSCATTVAMH